MKPLDSEETRYEEVFVSGVLSCCIKAFNPPPTITCPADLTVVTALPGDMSVVVNYPPPAVTDNCPGATVVCSPPSGASFPLGMTTVNCTVTDSGGATASCSLKVTVWDVCIQDDRRGDVLLFKVIS